MNKRITFFFTLLLVCVCTFGQKTYSITVVNDMKSSRTSEPVVINLNALSVKTNSAIVTYEGKEVPYQLDDLNDDGIYDELCFLTNIDKKEKKTFNVTLYPTGKPKSYPSQVYVEMLLSNKKIKESNKQDLYISQLTVDNGVNAY